MILMLPPMIHCTADPRAKPHACLIATAPLPPWGDPNASPSDNPAGTSSACRSDDPNANPVNNPLLLPVIIPMLLLLADAAAVPSSCLQMPQLLESI